MGHIDSILKMQLKYEKWIIQTLNSSVTNPSSRNQHAAYIEQ
jgi:hypothetical protein